ncbi:ankyrin repeat protein [Pigeonpox virus]|uniref:Ankyrin repeat protein n=1 Tax=Pigeonpox virus TaxID=10264 RepID=A0A068EEC2_9POXV|nr:ankyrin repeat protein [Pigeonpox virus]AID46531.1 ankyrin repeat protein [Pigeonpox virus]
MDTDMCGVDNDGYTYLYKETAKGNIKKVVELLSKGVNPNTPNVDSYAPLHIATKTGNVKIIRRLIKYGADVNKETIDGFTPLLIAIYTGDIKTCDVLLDRGANPNYVNKYGITPLIITIIYDRPTILNLLMYKGANCNQIINIGQVSYTIMEYLMNFFDEYNMTNIFNLIPYIIISKFKAFITSNTEGFNRNISVITKNSRLLDIALKCKSEITYMNTRGIGDKSLFVMCILEDIKDINPNSFVNFLDNLIESQSKLSIYGYTMNRVIEIGRYRKELLCTAVNINSYKLTSLDTEWQLLPINSKLSILSKLDNDNVKKLILNDAMNIDRH